MDREGDQSRNCEDARKNPLIDGEYIQRLRRSMSPILRKQKQSGIV